MNETKMKQETMEEQTCQPVTEEEIEKEITKAQEAMENAKNELIRNVYNSINYRALFETVGQLDKYDAFEKYVTEYEKNTKDAVEKGDTMPPALPWHHFLEDGSISVMNVAEMWDQIIQLATYVSITSAQVIDGTIYDTVTAPQFNNVQDFLEQFAHAMGAMTRRVETLEQKVSELEANK